MHNDIIKKYVFETKRNYGPWQLHTFYYIGIFLSDRSLCNCSEDVFNNVEYRKMLLCKFEVDCSIHNGVIAFGNLMMFTVDSCCMCVFATAQEWISVKHPWGD